LHADFAGYLHSVGSLEFAMENWKKALSIYRAYHPDASAESCNIMGSMVDIISAASNTTAHFIIMISH
jgi:hypothetical protein